MCIAGATVYVSATTMSAAHEPRFETTWSPAPPERLSQADIALVLAFRLRAMSVEAVVAMQACARLGAIHCVVFGGFSAHALHDRVTDTGAVAVITSDEQVRGGRKLPLKALVEGVPTHPDAARFWRMIEQHRVTAFYTAPTAIRALIKAADVEPAVHPRHFDLRSLRVLGSVGEPINPAAWDWYHLHVGGGRCPIVDTWWQTETGGHMITPLPGATNLVPGSCTLPFPGIAAAIVDETGEELPNGRSGLLVIKRPWPSMIRTIWGDPARYVKSYFPEELRGCYLAGDGAARDAVTGYFTIGGRIDDVLNVSGHRMGTMEIESALVACVDLVAEAAVVGKPDETTGESICAFVVLKRSRPEGAEAQRLATELRNWVGKEIGPIAKPKEIRFADALPKTRSGKIMRRLLRSIAKGEAITQDVSTLENPAILDQLAHSL